MDDLKLEESFSDYGYAVFDCRAADELESMSMIKYGTLLVCEEGSAVIEVNMLEYMLAANMCVVLSPGMMLRVVSLSGDFKITVLQTSHETSLASFIGLETEMFNVIYREPCFAASDLRELTLLRNFIENLRVFTQLPPSAHKKDFVYGTIHCIYVTIYDMRLRMVANETSQGVSYTSADNYFRQFLHLINDHCRLHHDVAFYADKLHITPKYLNEISRKKANFTAKEVITQFIVTLIKRELLVSGNSVQRIAYDYNFCDQSSLGKFFKKATGMSPVAYRRMR